MRTMPAYIGDPDAPETKEHFGELTAFFDKYLAA